MHTTLSDKVLEVAPRADAGDTDGIGALLGRKFVRLLVEYGQNQFGGLSAHPFGEWRELHGSSEDTVHLGLVVEGPTLADAALRPVFVEPGGEVVEGEGLEQVARDTELHGPLDGIGLVGRTDDDHIAIGPLDSDLADQIEAEDVGQVQVEQDEVRTQRARRLQRIGPGVCDADGAEAVDPVHERRVDACDAEVIVNDQDGDHGAPAALARVGASRGSAG